MGKIVVIGSSNTDMVVRGRMPLPGETVIGGDFAVLPGGKGANQAVAAARAGTEVTFIAKVGTDEFGKSAIEGYAKDNINTSFVFKDPNHPSGVAMIIVDDQSGQNSIVVAPGANAQLSPSDLEVVSDLFAQNQALLIQLETPLDTVKKGLEMAKRAQVLTILNPAPAQPLKEDLLQLVDIITPNETETEILTGISLDDDLSIDMAARALLEKVKQAVIITLGKRGVYFVDHAGKSGFINTVPVTPVDTTAAGDVFNGYLVAALTGNRSLEEAIKWANKAAAISVTRIGAQPSIPHFNEIEI